MRLTVLGSADASNSEGRGHSCYWLDGVCASGLMVDFGATALMALKRFGRQPHELGTLLFTHLHGDHIGGFPFFFVDALYGARPRTEPLRIVGPVGVRERLIATVRVAYGGMADTEPGFPVTWAELAPGDELPLEGGRVRGFPAEHMDPPEKPLCLRITSPAGRSVAFSGDTRMCDGLREAAKGADLLVAECTDLAPPAGRHTTWEDWQVELPTIGAGRVLLTHLATRVRLRIDELKEEAPPGVALDFAEDGMVLEV